MLTASFATAFSTTFSTAFSVEHRHAGANRCCVRI
jgi:hypothetical protein